MNLPGNCTPVGIKVTSEEHFLVAHLFVGDVMAGEIARFAHALFPKDDLAGARAKIGKALSPLVRECAGAMFEAAGLSPSNIIDARPCKLN